MERRVADEPFAEPHARHFDLLAVLHGELHLELAAFLVQQQDAERAVVDDALGQLRDAARTARRGRAPTATSRPISASVSKRFGVAPASLEQPRVDERDGDVRRELPHDGDVAVGELIAVAAEDVERANRPRLVHQRHDDLRVHAGHELDVARIGCQVVDEQRLLGRDRDADESLRRA